MAWFLLFLHLFLFHFPLFSSSFNFSCHHDESFALLQFESSFTLLSSTSFDYCTGNEPSTTTWKNGTDCCSWNGVTCDTISGRVIGLNLGCEGLQGILHPNSTLFHLVHLQTLNLVYNNFSGSRFHSKFGGFQSLTHLYLSYSNIYGEIPTQISYLSKLQSLYLSGNELVLKEITLNRLLQNATDLQELFLYRTNMSSIRPNSFPLLFNQSSSLVILSLKATELSGNLKNNFLCLPSIQELYMSDNPNFEGQLPELSCSISLRILDLSVCQFQGKIPISFSNLAHLTSLILSSNRLNGSIPSSLLTLPRLTFLDLGYNQLSGRIPNAFQMSNKFQKLDLSHNKIEGVVPTSISNLQQLIHLDLGWNSFSDQIPSSLSNLQQLIHLDLGSNSFSGQILSSFSNLQQLIHLDLGWNSFSGQIPFSLSNLQQLIHLDISSNAFSGPIPDVFGGMTKLQELDLDYNKLEGQIPSSLFNLTQLVALGCSNNKLDGPLPNKITGFQKLTNLRLNDNLINGTIPSSLLSYSLDTLVLSNNRLQGNIPECIFSLTKLDELDLSSNNLSGVVNFKLFSKFADLEILSLSRNSQLSLKFESNVTYSFTNLQILKLSSVNLIEFHNLQGEFPSLSHLDLSKNKLNGRMPNWFLGNIYWQSVDLSHNLFTSIDQFINLNASEISVLDLSFNLLNGEIPLAVCDISSLEFLNLGNNNLTGVIPQCLAESPFLYVLNLQMNKFHGTLPSNFSKESRIVSLNLYGNQLEGHFPKSLSRCKKLAFLNLGSNRIEDSFPDWLQTLPDLKVLVLRDNKLHGPIENLKIEHLFPSLIIFDISGNSFSGFLPKAYLKNYEAMKNVTQLIGDSNLQYMDKPFDMSYTEYSDSVTVEIKGNKMTLVKIPIKLVSIDLSRNKFEGEITNAIGELHALKGLNLSRNRLTGHIPNSIGNLAYLESLDLSSNMLTSVIPAELTNLGFLEVLDISNNHLVGEIPQGKQFNTFTNDSYEGNSGLCGLPLSKKCGPEQHSPPSANNSSSWNEEKFGFGWKAVAIGYACGFVIGISIGYYMFLIGKPRWLVMIFGGQPKRRVTRRTRVRSAHGSNMNQNQMVQMS
ncbi:putative leucine-rich repeat-containing, plant-type, leucine-rich repeat domain, L [Medicago truncatula]|uniref:Putative leucine-rich repeat-containing, plant-type, leucine-rich repeat domain, L n=1 Tax=Medicago truncatula TaxID=3880 RepID=G7JN57_MEDTR|nr:receptor-like protein 9DC3 [Medicago truncatula]AES87694.2 receptor-like protein [Medicago truncatula]RHN59516.1 putative leucine-rich repeat-containing, plant-type, leucine-rich repeat domain, L [Medicago truncatula]